MLHRQKFPLNPSDCANVRHAICEYILPGTLPEKPFMRRNERVVTLGSCFAAEIAIALHLKGVPATHISHNEVMNTAPAMEAIMSKCAAREPGFTEAADSLLNASTLILTLGVALTPYATDGRPLLDNITRDNAGDIHFRMLSPEEIERHTLVAIRQARAINPRLAVILTVSPLPLKTSYGGRSVFTEDCLSKSSLRFAVELLMRTGTDDLYYWPSFEMVRWLSPHVGPVFGVDGADNRHISRGLTEIITDLFIESYFDDSREPTGPMAPGIDGVIRPGVILANKGR